MKLCLHYAPGIISALIRWQTRSKYSHASLLFSDGIVIEAREFVGVHLLPKVTLRKGARCDVYEVYTTPEQEMVMRNFAMSQLGKPYDYVSIARFLTREPVKDWQKNNWFCSEFCDYAFELARIRLLNNIQSWAVSPAQLSLSPLIQFEKRIHG